MRLDKYLKVSRIIKRRSVANEVCSAGRVMINGRQAKPGAEIKAGDTITIRFGGRESSFEVLSISEHVPKAEANALYRVIEGGEIE